MRRLVLLLLLLATPAHATIWYISPVGSDSSSGIDASHPFRTFKWSLDALNSGDTLLAAASLGVIASGQYADGIIPWDQYHNTYSVTVIGDSVVPNRVIVPGINIYGTQIKPPNEIWQIHDYRVIGFRVNGDVSLATIPGYGDANGAILSHLVIAGSFTNNSCDFYAHRVTFGTGHDSVDAEWRSTGNYRGVTLTLDSCTVDVAPLTTPLYSDYMFSIHTDNSITMPNTPTIRYSTIKLYKPDGYDPNKCTIFKGLKNADIHDNTFTYTDSSGLTPAGTGTDGFGFLFRDDLTGNHFVRNSFTFHTLRPGTGKGYCDLTSSGSVRPGYGNIWRSNTFKSDMPTPKFVRYQWQMQPQDSFCYNVVVDSTAVARSGFYVHGILGNPTIYRNTFAHLNSGGGAFMLADDAVPNDATSVCRNWNSLLSISGNIYYTKQTGTGASDYAAACAIPSIQSVALSSDYNLFSHYGGNARSLDLTVCGGSATLKSMPMSTTTIVMAAPSMETHSIYGSPGFVDSSFANFDAHLTAASAGLLLVNGVTDAGAFDLDRIRPYAISDLYVQTATSTQALLRWTETGDDSLSGKCVGDTLRYSTSTITSGNWLSATLVAGLSAPATSGTLSQVLVTGLSPSTKYYFAIKAADKAGNVSAISNIASVTTPGGGPGLGKLPAD